MGNSTEELNSQIADTRGSLSSDLDALQDRVSPTAIVERRKAAARDSVTSVKSKVMGSARQAKDSASGAGGDATSAAEDAFEGSPLAAGLAAFGLGVVIAALIPASQAEAKAATKVVDKAKESGAVDQAKSIGQDVGSNLKESATDAAQQVKGSAQDSASKVKDEGQSSVDNVKSQAPGQG